MTGGEKQIAAVILALALPAVARADDWQSARHVQHVDDIVWAVTAKCDGAADDTAQRQCRAIRDEAARGLAGATLLVEADREAFEVTGWSAAKKSIGMRLAGCIACSPVTVDGKPWFVAGTAASPHLEGGKLRAANLYDNAKPFADEAAAVAWAKTVRNVRVQMLVKVPAKPARFAPGAGKDGLALEIVGYRVVSPCDGAIVIASPASGPIEPDKKACVPAPPAHP